MDNIIREAIKNQVIMLNNKINENQQKIKETNNNKKKKNFSERAGDWVCFKCKNLNFSFRNNCNRCQLTKNDSAKLTGCEVNTTSDNKIINPIPLVNIAANIKVNKNKYDSFIPKGNNNKVQDNLIK